MQHAGITVMKSYSNNAANNGAQIDSVPSIGARGYSNTRGHVAMSRANFTFFYSLSYSMSRTS